MFLCLLLLSAFTRRVAEFEVKNYPQACLRVVFNGKERVAHSAKAFKRVYLGLFSFQVDTTVFAKYFNCG